MNCWVVYVAGSKAEKNYHIGINNGIWGLKNLKKDSRFQNMKVGDEIIFVRKIQWPQVFGKRPSGYPKFFNDSSNFKGIMKEIIKGKVTKGYYQDTTPVWPDDVYPHRFNFKIQENIQDVLFTQDTINQSLIDSAFRSIKTAGDVCLCANSSMFEQNLVSWDNDDDAYLEDDNKFSVNEGRIFIKAHRSRERNQTIVNKKKQAVLAQKKCLECEVCGFDFVKAYGEKLGYGFSECHHINPLADSGPEETNTKLSDLIIICANCHRMIHRRKPWLLPSELKEIYDTQKKHK